MRPIIFIYLTFTLFANCSENGEQKRKQKSATGLTEIGSYSYELFGRNNGPTPKPGQLVQYHYRIKQGEKVLANSFGGDPPIGILPSEEEAKNSPQALIEGLRLMAEGDSLVVTVPYSGSPDSAYSYEIVLVKIFDVSGKLPPNPSETQVPETQ